MSAVKIPTDEELFYYLELPEGQRAGEADEFLEKASRRILHLGDRLEKHAKSVLARFGLGADHHAEEVVGRVTLKALQKLKRQMFDEPVNLTWRRRTPMFAYLLLIHGRPFDRKRSGVITNYIRKHGKAVYVSLTELSGTDMEPADSQLDAEAIVILKEDLRAINERRQQREAALNELAKSMPRDVLVYRLRTGIHRFQKLDPEIDRRARRQFAALRTPYDQHYRGAREDQRGGEP